MSLDHPKLRLTEQDYLEQDRANEFRSEWIDGEMFAMAGGPLRHSALANRLGKELEVKLTGHNCTVFNADVRIRTPSTGAYVYADVSVVCGPVSAQPNTTDILLNPVFVAEVLSPSTVVYDRGRKFRLYREIDCFKEYLLVQTATMAVSHFSRQPDDSRIFRETTGVDSTIFLPALDVTFTLGNIYGNAMSLPG